VALKLVPICFYNYCASGSKLGDCHWPMASHFMDQSRCKPQSTEIQQAVLLARFAWL